MLDTNSPNYHEFESFRNPLVRIREIVSRSIVSELLYKEKTFQLIGPMTLKVQSP